MRKIAFWRTCADAYRSVFGQPVRLLQLAWPQIPAIFGVVLLGTLRDRPVELAITAAIVSFYSFLTWFAFTVALYRAILVNEVSWVAAINLGRRTWRTMGNSVLIALVILVPVVIFLSVMRILRPALVSTLGVSAVIVLIVLGAFVTCVIARLNLVFPAIALDETNHIIRSAWARARGNTWALLIGSLLVSLPVAILSRAAVWLLYALYSADKSILSHHWMTYVLLNNNAVGQIASPVITILELAIVIAFYAHVYRQLAGDGERTPAPELSPPASASPPAPDTVIRTRK